MIAHHRVGGSALHAEVLEPALVAQSAAHRRVEIMAALGAGDRRSCLCDRLPLGLRDPLVLVDLGVLFLVEQVFADRLDLCGVRLVALVLVALSLALGRRRSSDSGFDHLILGVRPFRLGTIDLRQDRLGASIIPKILVVLKDLQQRQLKSAVDLALFRLQTVDLLPDQGVGREQIGQSGAFSPELLELLHVPERSGLP